MPRGQTAQPGDERWSPNGYLYRRTETRGWLTVHRLNMEEKLGRELKSDEYVTFKDCDKQNHDINNLELRKRGRSSLRRKLAQVEARLNEITAVKQDLERRLEIQEGI